MKRSTHTLALRSQEWMMQALLSILMNKSLQDITICELCRKADVSRRTFYRNFEDKEDVLNLYFSILQQEYIELLKGMKESEFHSLAFSYFTFWFGHLDFLKAAKRNHALFAMLLDLLNTFIPNLYAENSTALQVIPYDIHFIIGGFQNVLMTWIKGDCQDSIEQITETISPMFHDHISFFPKSFTSSTTNMQRKNIIINQE